MLPLAAECVVDRLHSGARIPHIDSIQMELNIKKINVLYLPFNYNRILI
jgi:hypothetical protein